MQNWDHLLSQDLRGDVANRCVVVAGGASGMGAALADAYNGLGAKVVIIDKNRQCAESLGREMVDRHPDSPSPAVIAADLTVESERWDAVREVIQKAGLPIAFISTIGFDRRVPLEGHSQDDLEMLLRINFIAPVMLARDFLPYMRQAGGGAMCLFSSHHGYDLVDIDMMGYGCAKAALENGIYRLARFAAEDNTADNFIRVFGIRPGWVQTPNQTSRFQKDDFDNARHGQLIPVPMNAADVVPFVIAMMSERYGRLLGGTIVNYDAGADQFPHQKRKI